MFANSELDLHKEQFNNIGTTKKQISAFQLIFKSLRHQRSVKYVCKSLIGIAERKNDYALTAKEKNTLFKNAAKLIRAYKQDCEPAIAQIGELSRLCNVNLYEFKDKRGKGLNDRLFDLWSQDIKKASTCNRVLNEYRPRGAASNAENWLTKIIQQSMESGKILDIFRGSIHNSQRILEIDSDNALDINGLERPQYKDVVIQHLATAREVDAKKFVDFMRLANERMKGMNVQQEVMKVLEMGRPMQLNLKDAEEETGGFGFKGGKFTRRKPGNGNLKRKVGDEIQGDLPLPLLT